MHFTGTNSRACFETLPVTYYRVHTTLYSLPCILSGPFAHLLPAIHRASPLTSFSAGRHTALLLYVSFLHAVRTLHDAARLHIFSLSRAWDSIRHTVCGITPALVRFTHSYRSCTLFTSRSRCCSHHTPLRETLRFRFVYTHRFIFVRFHWVLSALGARTARSILRLRTSPVPAILHTLPAATSAFVALRVSFRYSYAFSSLRFRLTALILRIICWYTTHKVSRRGFVLTAVAGLRICLRTASRFLHIFFHARFTLLRCRTR